MRLGEHDCTLPGNTGCAIRYSVTGGALVARADFASRSAVSSERVDDRHSNVAGSQVEPGDDINMIDRFKLELLRGLYPRIFAF
jgi:hypothetical protein